MNRSWYHTSNNDKSPDTVHQILAYGTLEEISSMKEASGEEKIKELFLDHPKKVYTLAALNFTKNFILHISNSIDEQKYLKYTPRNIG